MGKWLAKFSADIPESRTARADAVGEMGTMSGMSVRDIEDSATNTPPHPADEPTPSRQSTGATGRTIQAGDMITWRWRGQAQQGLVDFIHIDDTGTRWACVSIGKSWAFVNLKIAKVGMP